MSTKRSGVAILAVVATTVLGMKNVYGELVFEEDLAPKEKISKSADLSDDFAGEEDSLAGEGLEKDAVSSRADERSDISRAESLRRHRMRAELKNEDRLTEKLEELRLKDEVKRMNDLLGQEQAKKEAEAQAQLTEEKVGALAVPASSSSPAPVAQTSIVGSAAAGQSLAEAEVKKEDEKENKNRISIMPRGGLSGIISSNIEVSSKYSLGLSIGVDVSEHFAVEIGYTRSEYRIATGNMYYGTPFMGGLQAINMSQNVFDVGPRFNILNSKSRIRPFIAAGIGYYRNNLNMDQQSQMFLRAYNPALASDFIVSGFLGYLGTGAEVKVTDNISITGLFRYYNMLSSTSSNPVATAAVLNGTTVQGATPTMYGDPRDQASRNLGKANFYTVQAGVSLSF